MRGGKSCGQTRRLVRSSLPLPAPARWPFSTRFSLFLPLPIAFSLSLSISILYPPLRQHDVLPTARTTHCTHTVTHTSASLFALFLRFFSLSANPSHRPPGDLAGNQTRGSHGVHSRTKDSHPRRRSTTSSHAAWAF